MEEILRIGWIMICCGIIGYVIGLCHSSFMGKKGIPEYKNPPNPPGRKIIHQPEVDHTEITVKLMEDYTAKYLQENAELVQDTIKATLEAIHYTHCCSIVKRTEYVFTSKSKTH